MIAIKSPELVTYYTRSAREWRGYAHYMLWLKDSTTFHKWMKEALCAMRTAKLYR